MMEDTVDFAPRHVAFSTKTKNHSGYQDVELHELPKGYSPQREPMVGRTNRPECRFNYWRELVIWLSILFYVCDLCLDYWVCVRHFERNKGRRAWFIFFCILMPNLYSGYKSLQWYLRAHDQQPVDKPLIWIIRVLFFPVSPILRYFDAWWYGRKARSAWREDNMIVENKYFTKYLEESAEVAMLRLFLIFLEDAPIAVVNLEELIDLPHENWEKDAAVLIGVVTTKLACTMTLGVVHYISVNKMAYHAALSHSKRHSKQSSWQLHGDRWENKGMLSRYAEVCVYCWQLLCIGSRLMAYSMFSVVYFQWLWLLVLLRWCIHTFWIYFDVKEMSWAKSILFGGVYLFTFVTTSPGRQILRVLLYYVITFAEDIIIVILWSTGAPHNPFKQIAIGVMLGSASGGIIFLSMYYGIFHPESKSTWLRQWLHERWRQSRVHKHGRQSGEPTGTSYGDVSEA